MSEFAHQDAYRDFARALRDDRRWIHKERAAAFLASVRKARIGTRDRPARTEFVNASAHPVLSKILEKTVSGS